MEEVTPWLEEYARACWGRVLDALRKGFGEADRVSRDCVSGLQQLVDRIDVVRVIEIITGGLGYDKSSPLDPAQMALAGSIIAWPEAVKPGARVLEIGTGIGRTCYVIHYYTRPSLYLTIDSSPEILAVAFYRNPSRDFSRCLSSPDVKILLCDAVQALKLVESNYFDHVVHDGGPNPVKNPRLYSLDFFKQLYRVMKPCATISVFAGRSRRGRQMVYNNMVEAGFTDIHAVSFPNSPALVYRARKPCSMR